MMDTRDKEALKLTSDVLAMINSLAKSGDADLTLIDNLSEIVASIPQTIANEKKELGFFIDLKIIKAKAVINKIKSFETK